jgi:hypothetical protein
MDAKEKKAEWRRANRERLKELKRESYARNRDAVLAANKAYREKNKERIYQQRKEAYAANADGKRAAAKKRRAENAEAIKQRARQYRADNKAQHLAYEVKSRSRKNGLPCDLDAEWVQGKLAAGACEMTGLPFDSEKRGPNSPSIDRINPRGGYTKDNCRMIVWALNRAMSNHGEDMLIGMVKLVLAKRGDL